mgnify:CR=1 FL=1
MWGAARTRAVGTQGHLGYSEETQGPIRVSGKLNPLGTFSNEVVVRNIFGSEASPDKAPHGQSLERVMLTASLDERILETLKSLIEHHSSSRSVAEQMGQAHNYVARLLRGETKLRREVLKRT